MHCKFILLCQTISLVGHLLHIVGEDAYLLTLAIKWFHFLLFYFSAMIFLVFLLFACSLSLACCCGHLLLFFQFGLLCCCSHCFLALLGSVSLLFYCLEHGPLLLPPWLALWQRHMSVHLLNGLIHDRGP